MNLSFVAIIWLFPNLNAHFSNGYCYSKQNWFKTEFKAAILNSRLNDKCLAQSKHDRDQKNKNWNQAIIKEKKTLSY
jgi:hypothetical protein